MMKPNSELNMNDMASEAVAEQWFTYLKKQSQARLMIAAVLFIALLSSVGFGLKFYMDNQTLNSELIQKISQIDGLKTNLSDKSAQLVEVTKDLVESEKKRGFLEQIKGDTASQLGVAEQIIDMQKQKIILLESEYQNSINVTAELESQLQSVEGQAQQLAQDLDASRNELGQRSSAYKALVKRQKDTRLEVDRLAKELEMAQSSREISRKALAQSKIQVSKLKKDLTSVKAELAQIKADNIAEEEQVVEVESKAEEHLSLAVQPIVAQPKIGSAGDIVDPNALMIP